MKKNSMTNRRNLIIFILIMTCGCCCSVFAQSKARKSKFGSSSSSQSSLAERIETALNADFGGTVDVEDLLLDRSEYIGKVVKVRYSGLYCYISSSSGSCRAHIYDDDHNLSLYLTLPEDREARKWIIDVREDDSYYANGNLYVYVEAKSLLAVGERRKKKSGRYEYGW